ncbi:uncharacterized protein M421DRAFT_90404 [Didymella exigua CBS 183.55]|uniref:Uncharacterized protein n=1 Tax=Didymella exigua CBS 183.55 TaxID=1150837 RepID=A0A6A5RWG0_9PLEO|nr:uncharacterized protein M421DRAFT_90404 [Didymella exigua CBS 183.55]KAF1931338.1 hypothetical protein M421DRAFT_90404 [Didymella exigua CBS 183.55]
MYDATGKILRAEARLLDGPLYRHIIINDPWILEAFTIRTDQGGYVRFPPETKLQFEPVGLDNLDADAPFPDTARLTDVTKVPASEAFARQHADEGDRAVTKNNRAATNRGLSDALDQPEGEGGWESRGGDDAQVPDITKPAPFAPPNIVATAPEPASAPSPQESAATTEAAAFASITPDHRCGHRITCKICHSTPSLPWLPSTADTYMAKVIVRMSAGLTQADQFEFGQMYNLGIAVSKKTSAIKKEFHHRLRDFVVRHGIMDLYNEFATRQRIHAKDRYYRLPLFEDH